MITRRSGLVTAIQSERKSALEWAEKHPDLLTPGMQLAVLTQQVSRYSFHTFWRFAKATSKVGDTNTDPHPAYNREQVIMWLGGEPHPSPLATE